MFPYFATPLLICYSNLTRCLSWWSFVWLTIFCLFLWVMNPQSIDVAVIPQAPALSERPCLSQAQAAFFHRNLFCVHKSKVADLDGCMVVWITNNIFCIIITHHFFLCLRNCFSRYLQILPCLFLIFSNFVSFLFQCSLNRWLPFWQHFGINVPNLH